MKTLTDLLHPFTEPIWGERIKAINASISEYFDNGDVGFERVVNVWTSVDDVIDGVILDHIKDEIRRGI